MPNGCANLVAFAGNLTGRAWWAVKQARFEAGELDPRYPEIRRLGVDEVLPGVASRA